MPLIDALLPEFDREMGLTRKLLDRVPDGQFDWKPHPTSVTLGRLAEHLAEMPLWTTMTMTQSALEMTTQRPPDYQRPATRAAVLAMFDINLKSGGKEVFTMPKAAVMRNFVLNHMVHHRGRLVTAGRSLRAQERGKEQGRSCRKPYPPCC